MKKRARLVMPAVGLFVIGSIAGLAAAKGGVGGGGGAAGATPLKAKMTLVAGENPTAPGVLAAVAVATFDGKSRLRVHLPGMDPARFPAASKRNTVVPCTGTAKVAGLSGAPTLIGAPDPVTGIAVVTADLLGAGVANPGDAASIDLVCNVGGVVHETHWAGTLA